MSKEEKNPLQEVNIEHEQEVQELPQEEPPREFLLNMLALTGEAPSPIRTKHVGSFEHVLEQTGQTTHCVGARRIVDFFRSLRTDIDTPKGKVISRRPHLVIAGGFVRDLLMNKKPKDIDFATSVDYETLRPHISAYFARDIEEHRMVIKETGTRYKVMRLIFKNQQGDIAEEYEIASFRIDEDYQDGRRPERVKPVRFAGIDAQRRDLTINALFYNPFSGNVIDYVKGMKDIEDKRLRFVGDPEKRITEDHMRMLRFIRFLARTDFTPDEPSKKAILAHAALIKKLAMQPVKDEMDKVITAGSAGTVLERLKEYNLLEHLLSEINDLQKCLQGPPYHMEGNALTHTIMAANNLPADAPVFLRWAAILHDLGKPDTRKEEITPEGIKISFVGHEEKSAEIARAILNRFRFSDAEKQDIIWLVENHIRAFDFPEMRESKAKAFCSSPLFPLLIELARADTHGSVPNDEKIRIANEDMLDAIQKRYAQITAFQQSHKEQLSEIAQEINGDIIIKRFEERFRKRPAGKLIGRIKNSVQEEIKEKNITDVEEARRILQKHIETFGKE